MFDKVAKALDLLSVSFDVRILNSSNDSVVTDFNFLTASNWNPLCTRNMRVKLCGELLLMQKTFQSRVGSRSSNPVVN